MVFCVFFFVDGYEAILKRTHPFNIDKAFVTRTWGTVSKRKRDEWNLFKKNFKIIRGVVTFELFLFDHDKIVKNNIWNADNRFSCLNSGIIIAEDNNCIFFWFLFYIVNFIFENRRLYTLRRCMRS